MKVILAGNDPLLTFWVDEIELLYRSLLPLNGLLMTLHNSGKFSQFKNCDNDRK
jgi:hypothetical protein